ncbi:MAG: C4-dicarboxylate ABC transporter [Angelakisella sp.]|jgi:putative tricarboxylic transport membrane protein|nr:C4-dicarboxylate ABC transporter [Angelakisella sp.]MCI9529841.1 C4-dicarboxylate ABC transporter [Angelakisella sp.]
MQNILLGLSALMQPQTLLFLFIGTVVGLIIGALPGLTGNMAIALMVPVTFTMDPTTGLAFLTAIYCSSIFGGSISAILLGIPGTISSFATTLDGYPMALQGKAGTALGVSTLSSVFGGVFSAIVLMSLTSVLAEFALTFGPAEYFAVAVLGLSCIASIGGKSISKGLLSGFIGLFIACIGMDPQTGVKRYTFGNINLLSGVEMVAALIGLFGVISVLKSAEKAKKATGERAEEKMPDVGSTWIGWKMCAQLLPTWLRGAVIGTVVGIIPGAGTNVATFLAYDTEKKISKDGDTFGKGNPKGVAAPESANNGVTGGSLVPLLALGVPGNATSALFLSALMLQGLATGPVLFTDHADIVYALFLAFFICNIIMAPLGLFLLRYMKKILSVPESLMGGIILAFCVTGVFSIATNPFDVITVIVFGVLGYVFYKFDIPSAPLIVCLVLGSMAERNLRQALVANSGSYSFLWTRPITLMVLLISLFSFFAPIISKAVKSARKRRQPNVVSVNDMVEGSGEELDDD